MPIAAPNCARRWRFSPKSRTGHRHGGPAGWRGGTPTMYFCGFAPGLPGDIATDGAFVSIKPDKWIRRMAEQHGMIEPFEPGQVKQNGGGRIVSYGTSSYGYDVRCAGEFKIFTNINSTIVDPKDFDSRRSEERRVGEECRS